MTGAGSGTVPYQASVQTTYWGNRAELVEVLDLAARGLLHAETTHVPLAEAAGVHDLLRRGEVSGRVVVVPYEEYRP